MEIKNSYRDVYNYLIEMNISKKDSKYLVNNFHSLFHSPINYLCGYPSILRLKIKGALEKKLSGENALRDIEKDLIIRN